MWSFYFIVEFFCFHIDLCVCKYSFNVSIEVLLLLRNMHISNYEKSHKLKFKKLYYDFSHLHFEFPANNIGPMKSVKNKNTKTKKKLWSCSLSYQDGNKFSELIMNLSASITQKIISKDFQVSFWFWNMRTTFLRSAMLIFKLTWYL